MAESVFHKDFKPMPWWWEWWHPSNEFSQDPPLKTDVVVVGAGYGGLSTGLELARSGVDVTVLERGDFGVGAYAPNVSDEVKIRITTEATGEKPAA